MNINYKKGFTLIEMMVALSVFAAAMLFALGAYVSIVSLQKRVSAFRALSDNLGFAMELMSREITEGDTFSGGGNSISFVLSSCNIDYFLSGNQLIRRESGPVSFCQNSTRTLTSSEIKIENLDFTIINDSQIIVNIIMKSMVLLEGGREIRFDMQTSAAKREFGS